jgi:hypothetical protein
VGGWFLAIKTLQIVKLKLDMSLYDRWTRGQLRAAVRRELMDPAGRFWSNDELNLFLNDWQNEVNHELEFVWGTATLTVGTGTETITHTALATDILRLDALYWNNVRLSARSKNDLNEFQFYWREASPADPVVAYTIDDNTFGLYPPVGTVGVLVSEHPVTLNFVDDDNSQMGLPAWTKYSAVNYATYRAYSRYGPNYDLNKSLRRKAKFERQLLRYKSLRDSFFPNKYLSIRPTATKYEHSILSPSGIGGVTLPVSVTLHVIDELPSGTKDGSNTAFVISRSTYESVHVHLNGIKLRSGVGYSISGANITMLTGYIPEATDILEASIIYRA